MDQPVDMLRMEYPGTLTSWELMNASTFHAEPDKPTHLCAWELFRGEPRDTRALDKNTSGVPLKSTMKKP